MKRDYEKSSGNVFVDLGFRNSKQELLKAMAKPDYIRIVIHDQNAFHAGCPVLSP